MREDSQWSGQQSRLCVQDRDTVLLPVAAERRSSSRVARLTILKVLEFNTQTLKSGVVVRPDDADAGDALLFVRGAPGVIRALVKPESLPPDFHKVNRLRRSRFSWALVDYFGVGELFITQL